MINTTVASNKTAVILTGLNLGIETWAAQAAVSNGNKYHVYVPFKDPEKRWPQSSQNIYTDLLKAAKSITVLDNGEFAATKLAKKEEKMIEDADIIYSLYPDNFNKLAKTALENNKKVVLLLDQNKAVATENGFYIEI